jgi:hypothetical protein
MFGILKSFRDFFLKSYSFLAAVAVLALSGMSGMVMAAPEATTVEVTTPNIDWGSVAADLIGALTSVAVVGLGVAISVWVLMLIARIFKRSAT